MPSAVPPADPPRSYWEQQDMQGWADMRNEALARGAEPKAPKAEAPAAAAQIIPIAGAPKSSLRVPVSDRFTAVVSRSVVREGPPVDGDISEGDEAE